MANRVDVNRRLQPGDTFRSENLEYRLTFQEDGNLVMYNSADEALWSTGTGQEEHPQGWCVVVQGDGNIVIYDAEQNPQWSSNSAYEGASSPHLIVQDDGNLVLYDDHVEGAHWTR